MREIVEKLKEARDIEHAKQIMKSAGYTVSKKMNEARSPEIEKMMDFIDAAGEEYDRKDKYSEFEAILDKHNASEDDNGPEGYFSTMSDDDIRAAYEELKNGTPDAGMSDEDIINIITEALYDQADSRIKKVETFREAGMMTKNNGLVITTVSGKEFQFSLLGSF